MLRSIKTNNRKNLCRSVVLLLFVMIARNMFSMGGGVIKDPVPNMEEKQYVKLKLISTLDSDLGNGEFLFLPFSMTLDSEHNLFVYDLLQAKIFKFDKNLDVVKSFARQGEGPGEFAGTGLGYSVYLSIGGDGNLYARDTRRHKIVVFDRNGRYIKDISYRALSENYPLVDDNGNVFLFRAKQQTLNVINQQMKRLFSIPLEKGVFDNLYFPHPFFRRPFVKKIYHKDGKSADISYDILVSKTKESPVLIYIRSSSTMYVIDNQKILNRFPIRPRDALAAYKQELKELISQKKNMYRYLFPYLFSDSDTSGIFYMAMGRNVLKGINALYQVNVKGELLKVFYLKLNESASFIRFCEKVNGTFIAISDDKIKIYK
jgi:hypothetical protein